MGGGWKNCKPSVCCLMLGLRVEFQFLYLFLFFFRFHGGL